MREINIIKIKEIKIFIVNKIKNCKSVDEIFDLRNSIKKEYVAIFDEILYKLTLIFNK